MGIHRLLLELYERLLRTMQLSVHTPRLAN